MSIYSVGTGKEGFHKVDGHCSCILLAAVVLGEYVCIVASGV